MKRFCLFLTTMLLFFTLPCAASNHSLTREQIPILSETEAAAAGLRTLGVLQGTEKGLELDRAVTRAEVLTFIQRTVLPELGNEPHTPCPFTDIAGHWAEETITTFYRMGLVNGTTETTYTPDRTVSGKELAKIMLTAMGYLDITIENAYENSVLTELITDNFTGSAVKQNLPLLRGDVVRLCFSALTAKMPSPGGRLYENRIARGLNTEEEFRNILISVTPAPTTPPVGSMNLQPIMDAWAALPDGGFAASVGSSVCEKTAENAVVSPFALKAAIGLAASGAAGETLREMQETCGFTDVQAFNQSTAGAKKRYEGSETVQLKAASGIFVNTDQLTGTFDEGFLMGALAQYGAAADTVTTETAAEKINSWAAENTDGKVTYLTADGDFAAGLMSAASITGDWEIPFPVADSFRGTFHDGEGTAYTVDYMQKTHSMPYYEDNSTQAVELPYRKGHDDVNLSLIVIMEKNEKHIPSGNAYFFLQDAAFTMQNVHLTMPKFEISYVENLLWVCDLYYAASKDFAEFDGIMPDGGLYLSRLMHRTHIRVDEGTGDAAAATAGAGQPAIEMNVNHAFRFLVRDNTTGEILFIGDYKKGA